MSSVDKKLLFKPRLPEADVEVEGIGIVRVRGLNRMEAMLAQAAADPAEIERKILSFGMVDPELTEAEVKLWQKASTAGEIEPVSSKIAELSGMLSSSAKEAVRDFEADPNIEFHVLPGAKAGHDSGSASGGDE
jgi:hypothetical protein